MQGDEDRTDEPEEPPESHWRQAYRIAEEFLRRWGGDLSSACREDCVAETAVRAVHAWGGLRDKERYPACVRTIARRQRARVVRDRVREVPVDALVDDVPALDEPAQTLWVAGLRVSRDALIAALPRMLGSLTPLNARLLMSYYEGFSCTELAERHHLSDDSVRMRIHRSRQLVRRLFERMAAGDSGARVRPITERRLRTRGEE